MNKLQALPLKAKIAIIAFPLLYVAIINIELTLSSQRYTVTLTSKSQGEPVKYIACLEMMDAITKEMEYEKTPTLHTVSRDKMNVFSKWFECGVL